MATTPQTLGELIEALTRLPSLDPLAREKQCQELKKTALLVLTEVGNDALAEEMEAKQINAAELARRLGVGRAAVAKRVRGRVGVKRMTAHTSTGRSGRGKRQG